MAPPAETLLETWTPERSRVRVPHRLWQLVPSLVLACLAALLAIHSTAGQPASPVLLLFILAPMIMALVWGSSSRHRPQLLHEGVAFELTDRVVRVRVGDRQREVRLHDIACVDVVRPWRARGVGHVIVRLHGEPLNQPLAIPTGRRVTGGTVGLVTWGSIEEVHPGDQLFEGAMTLWFVAHPEQVRDRICAAMRGLSPVARGPHR